MQCSAVHTTHCKHEAYTLYTICGRMTTTRLKQQRACQETMTPECMSTEQTENAHMWTSTAQARQVQARQPLLSLVSNNMLLHHQTTPFLLRPMKEMVHRFQLISFDHPTRTGGPSCTAVPVQLLLQLSARLTLRHITPNSTATADPPKPATLATKTAQTISGSTYTGR
jgi:hypothetical protein